VAGLLFNVKEDLRHDNEDFHDLQDYSIFVVDTLKSIYNVYLNIEYTMFILYPWRFS
jgi:hypothetical protein